jgi:hypothetical protein
MLWLAIFSCNFPGPGQGEPIPPAEAPAPAQPGQAAPSGGVPPSGTAQPAGEPVLTIQPGSGYLFASSQVVHGADPRDVWWNGATLVPGQKIASLGPVADLSSIDQIKPSLITEPQLQPVPGEGYVMATSDGKYVLLRMLSLGAQGEINVEFLYPFAGAVLP